MIREFKAIFAARSPISGHSNFGLYFFLDKTQRIGYNKDKKHAMKEPKPIKNSKKGETDMEFIKFNTGRWYTMDGQIIYATRRPSNPEEQVVFFDRSRGISGIVTCGLDPEAILREYDHNRYTDRVNDGDWDAWNALVDQAKADMKEQGS